MSKKRKFSLDGHDMMNEPFHYTACGLDDIYLVNGYERHDTAYGEGVSIHNIENLHRVIAEHIIERRKTLSNKEFRFLRKEMNLTQKELGELVGKDEQTIARYEKGQSPISSPVDKLVRVLYLLRMATPEELETIRTILQAHFDDDGEMKPIAFEVTNESWHERQLAA